MQRSLICKYRTWLTVFALAASAACAGTLDDPGRFQAAASDTAPEPVPTGADANAAAPACPDVVGVVFAQSCATAGCHAPPSAAFNLDLVSPDIASRVVGKAAMGGGLLVDPAQPAQSMIYRKLKPGAPGAVMPIGKPLDDATIACVLEWASGLKTPAASVPVGASDGGGFLPVRIAVGSTKPVTAGDGTVWSADTAFVGGTPATNTTVVKNTADPELYDNERYGTFSYSFAVPNGSYVVSLGFAETYVDWQAPGKRVFDVSVNGMAALTNFDIFVAAGADSVALKQIPVVVTGGSIKVAFDPAGAGNPKVNVISVLAQ